MKSYLIHHLVKSEDLNHHKTLFAGRMAEWFVEACFVAAASAYGKPEGIVCLKVHGFQFIKPIRNGSIIVIDSKVVVTGRTSLTVYAKVLDEKTGDFLVDGFITFVSVDEEGSKVQHQLPTPEAQTEEEVELEMKAKALKQQ